jgi:hypothetical protein
VLEVRTEGEAFCGPRYSPIPRATILGATVFEKLVGYSNVLCPLYGAIVVEYSLESPDELRRDSRSLAFRDFYLAKRALDERSWLVLDELLDDRVYRHEMSAGIYVSMSSYFNPEGKELPPIEAQELSVKIGEVLATSIRE